MHACHRRRADYQSTTKPSTTYKTGSIQRPATGFQICESRRGSCHGTDGPVQVQDGGLIQYAQVGRHSHGHQGAQRQRSQCYSSKRDSGTSTDDRKGSQNEGSQSSSDKNRSDTSRHGDTRGDRRRCDSRHGRSDSGRRGTYRWLSDSDNSRDGGKHHSRKPAGTIIQITNAERLSIAPAVYTPAGTPSVTHKRDKEKKKTEQTEKQRQKP